MSLRIVLRRTTFVPSLFRTNFGHFRPKLSPRLLYSRRNLSTDTVATAKSAESSIEAASSDATATNSLDTVVRHGAGDGIVCLDVGGKKFYTLKSTIAANPVLCDIVARAESNGELTSAGNAIFVDRDPKHFHTILTYLRNESEGLSFNKKTAFKKGTRRVQLPGDKAELADLYVEATYFQIDPLKDALCHHSLFTLAASSFSGGSNPFSTVADNVKTLRRVLLAFAGVSSMSVASPFGDLKAPAFLTRFIDDNGKEESEKNKCPKEPTPAIE